MQPYGGEDVKDLDKHGAEGEDPADEHVYGAVDKPGRLGDLAGDLVRADLQTDNRDVNSVEVSSVQGLDDGGEIFLVAHCTGEAPSEHKSRQQKPQNSQTPAGDTARHRHARRPLEAQRGLSCALTGCSMGCLRNPK